MAKSLYDPTGIGALDPDTFNQFQTGRRQARSAYDMGTAQNEYKRSVYRTDYGRDKNDLRVQYGRARRGFGSDYIKRGLLNSGLYKSAYRDLQLDKSRSETGLRDRFQTAIDGLALADRQLGRIKNDSLNDIESAETARRASVAAALGYAKENG